MLKLLQFVCFYFFWHSIIPCCCLLFFGTLNFCIQHCGTYDGYGETQSSLLGFSDIEGKVYPRLSATCNVTWVVATQICFIFTPNLGEDEPILTNYIFQRGWNPQLVTFVADFDPQLPSLNLFLSRAVKVWTEVFPLMFNLTLPKTKGATLPQHLLSTTPLPTCFKWVIDLEPKVPHDYSPWNGIPQYSKHEFQGRNVRDSFVLMLGYSQENASHFSPGFTFCLPFWLLGGGWSAGQHNKHGEMMVQWEVGCEKVDISIM